jgi:hypothetical protein
MSKTPGRFSSELTGRAKIDVTASGEPAVNY